MAEITRGNPGVSEFQKSSYDGPREPFLSDTPPAYTESFSVPANSSSSAVITLAYLEIVDISTAGVLAKATTVAIPSGHFRGVMAQKVLIAVSAAVDLALKHQVFLGGHFDGDALGWPAAFTTDAHKIGAFRGASAPVNIIVGFNKYNR